MKRFRKAVVAGLGAAAASFVGAAVGSIERTGKLPTAAEFGAAAGAAIVLGFGIGRAVWRVENAPAK